MNWGHVQINWKKCAGKLKERWDKLSKEDLNVLNGKPELWADKLEERYGIGRIQAERQLHEFVEMLLDQEAPRREKRRLAGLGRNRLIFR